MIFGLTVAVVPSNFTNFSFVFVFVSPDSFRSSVQSPSSNTLPFALSFFACAIASSNRCSAAFSASDEIRGAMVSRYAFFFAGFSSISIKTL